MKKTDVLSEKILFLLGFKKEPLGEQGADITLPFYFRDGVTVYYDGIYLGHDEPEKTDAKSKGYIATDKALLTVEDLDAYYKRKTGRSLGLYNPN